jgi:hypothetical protein
VPERAPRRRVEGIRWAITLEDMPLLKGSNIVDDFHHAGARGDETRRLTRQPGMPRSLMLVEFGGFFGDTFHQDGHCVYADDRVAICLIDETGTAPGGDRFDNLAVYTLRLRPDGQADRIWTVDLDAEDREAFWRKTLANPQKTFPRSRGLLSVAGSPRRFRALLGPAPFQVSTVKRTVSNRENLAPAAGRAVEVNPRDGSCRSLRPNDPGPGQSSRRLPPALDIPPRYTRGIAVTARLLPVHIGHKLGQAILW